MQGFYKVCVGVWVGVGYVHEYPYVCTSTHIKYGIGH